jgi:Domain of unknown function (DUF4157)
MSFSRRRSPGSAGDEDAQVGGRAPGKRSRAEKRFGWGRSEPAATVQLREATAPGNRTHTGEPVQARSQTAEGERVGERLPPARGHGGEGQTHEVAESGIAGAGGPLPHLETIQRSFGEHDLGGVQAHTGAAAERAAGALGASAYASGNHVAFRDAPDLHTAAHEAAHVVQQRAGVQLYGGVGRSGDEYERNADAVADRVVSGKSAADLLPGGGRSGAGERTTRAGHVQRRPDGKGKAEKPMDYTVASNELRAASDIVQNRSRRLIGSSPGHEAVLGVLWGATVGRGVDGAEIDGRGRLKLFEEAMAGLRPAIAAIKSDPEGVSWLEEHLDPGVERLRGEIQYQIASQRVDRAAIVGERAVVEDTAESARAHAPLIRAQIQKQISTLALLNEIAVRLNEHEIKHAAKEMMKGHVPPAGKSWSDPGLLAHLQGVLYLADGWLTLTDEELPHHLAEIEGVAGHVASYAHLVKAVVELVGGTVSVGATFASIIARRAGQAGYAAQAAGLARMGLLTASTVVSAVEIVWGIAVLCDSHATPEEKDKAILGIGMGTAGLVGAVKGSAVGGPLSVAVLTTYLELKLMAHLYASANHDIIGGWMSKAFENISGQGRTIAAAGDELAKAGLLLEQEKDPAQQQALGRVQENAAARLGSCIDHFIDDCQPRTYAAGVARYPGAFTILREVFAPIMGLGGKKAPQDASAAGAKVLDRIVWCLSHQQELVDLAARKRGLDSLSERGEGGHGNEAPADGHGGGHGEEG